MKRRVVITGLGAITPIGNNVESFWKGIKLGKNGIDEISLFNAENLKVKMAAEVKDFDPNNFIDKKEAGLFSPASKLFYDKLNTARNTLFAFSEIFLIN